MSDLRWALTQERFTHHVRADSRLRPVEAPEVCQQRRRELDEAVASFDEQHHKRCRCLSCAAARRAAS